jgi:hypothetical protein
MASGHLGAGDFSSSGAHGVKAEERFYLDRPHRFYRASVGSTIERAVYHYILWTIGALEPGVMADRLGAIWSGQLPNGVKIKVAFEYTGQSDGFPSSFSRSRPDIRLSLGAGTDGHDYEALYDLTSEAQKSHILSKGDSWLSKAYVPYVAEILWTNDDILLK